ncbi:MAG: hypothetical protein JJ959_16870 [Nisaea sp.]|jgi:hypothetical protein|uniref:hypothetical protein n=1 Tax=Nisaea sp. TaxID=2024842 RepID=UPI001B2BE7CB|nr:hypothetical protein [Nisaea sp.]MBO6562220.1 hypothetical protein [Nisaea sp.]
MPTKWVLESDLLFLEPAVRFAGINPNAIREYPGPTRVSALTYPTPFCRSSVLWMRALSHLVVRNRDFELFLIEVNSENDMKETSRTRIYPVLDDQVIQLLTQINRADARDLKIQSQRVEHVLEQLKHRASDALKDEIMQLYSKDPQ